MAGSARTRKRRWNRTHLALFNWVTQGIIAVVGVIGMLDPTLWWMLVWCILASIYAISVIIGIGVHVRRESAQPLAEEDLPVWFGRLREPIVITLTVIPTLIGVTAAVWIIVLNRLGDESLTSRLIGVWAMLIAWGLLHFGFAQIYLFRSSAAWPDRIFDIPGSGRPVFVDLLYFAFTVGTTFAASDVSVLTTRTRWLVTLHSVASFFLNALIIVLAFNTIMGG